MDKLKFMIGVEQMFIALNTSRSAHDITAEPIYLSIHNMKQIE